VARVTHARKSSERSQSKASVSETLGARSVEPRRPFTGRADWIKGSDTGDFLVYIAPTSSVARDLSTRNVRRLDLPPPRFSLLEGNVYVESLDPNLDILERKLVRDAMRSLAATP